MATSSIVPSKQPGALESNGLRAGADDYLTKPFGSNERVARLEALLRRATPLTRAIEVYDDGLLRIDRSGFRLPLPSSGMTATEADRPTGS